ncbi:MULTISPECIES: response regulator [Legionella]|uniref:Response regulator n=1 Tax=Legionella septentrionalis TaxID=2498109 RepID=A0A433JMI3_9GAMM|nr:MULTISPECIES: response regulator [Legionella]MCP0914757.1 response regulator [Legionella sp. 27cVA30]RUQ91100.1 response regulator [Legionella septentrionalis]RUR02831.1 response regulator [Legionella septentrionalis]RUR11429.1 response regulator [Legionella septentrionalis]RUR15096.1 response regulator [Legionella septentrionalis]
MQVLVVEDSPFNAFCLSRLFQLACSNIRVSVALDSEDALRQLRENEPALIILDGNLNAANGQYCNGPALADVIWRNYPNLPIIAWTDCEKMLKGFAEVFKQHDKPFNEYSSWAKVISPAHIRQSLANFAFEFTAEDEQNSALNELHPSSAPRQLTPLMEPITQPWFPLSAG